MSTRTLSLHHLTMLDATPAELMDAALFAGYDHVGLRLVSPDDGSAFGPLLGDPGARREARARAEDLPGGILDVEAVWIRSETDVSTLASVIEATHDIGARYLLTVGHDTDHNRLVDKFGQFADLAVGSGVQLAIEPITYCGISDLASARALIDSLDRSDVGILIDALQFFRSNATVEALAETPEQLLPYAQIADATSDAPVDEAGLKHEARLDRRVPGEGGLPLASWLDALPTAIPLAVEVPSERVRSLPRNEAAQLLKAAVDKLLQGVA